jgi:hypothetical protein
MQAGVGEDVVEIVGADFGHLSAHHTLALRQEVAGEQVVLRQHLAQLLQQQAERHRPVGGVGRLHRVLDAHHHLGWEECLHRRHTGCTLLVRLRLVLSGRVRCR